MDIQEIIDIESAKERFMNNYGLFSKYLFQFPERSLYGDLKDALVSGNVQHAFEIAHTMKGIVANLSLKLVETPLHVVVEILRAGNLPGDSERQNLEEAYQRTVDVIRMIETQGKQLFLTFNNA